MPKKADARRHAGEPSKREELRARRKRREQMKRWIPLALIGLLAVAIAVFLIVSSLAPKDVNSRPLARGLEMGNANAAVQVEEFADFQCPSCAVFVASMEPDLVKKFVETGKINFKFVPYSFIGEESVLAAKAAYCANDQNKFWEYHDTLFNNQSGENQGFFTNTRMVEFARKLGLNIDQFTSCLSTGKYEQKVKDDLNYGQSKNIDRTPSFLVNGRLVYADTVLAVIDSAVNTAGN